MKKRIGVGCEGGDKPKGFREIGIFSWGVNAFSSGLKVLAGMLRRGLSTVAPKLCWRSKLMKIRDHQQIMAQRVQDRIIDVLLVVRNIQTAVGGLSEGTNAPDLAAFEFVDV